MDNRFYGRQTNRDKNAIKQYGILSTVVILLLSGVFFYHLFHVLAYDIRKDERKKMYKEIKAQVMQDITKELNNRMWKTIKEKPQ